MKMILGGLIGAFALGMLSFGQTVGDGLAVVPVGRLKEKVPVFYSLEAETTVRVGLKSARSVMGAKFRMLQGRPEVLTMELSGEGRVESVSGDDLISWAVREESDGRRFLDLFPKLGSAERWTQPALGGDGFEFRPPMVLPNEAPKEFTFEITGVHSLRAGEGLGAMIPGAGKAVGFSATILMTAEAGARVKVLELGGLMEDRNPPEGAVKKYLSFGLKAPNLFLKVEREGGSGERIELVDAELVGRLADDQRSAIFTLEGGVRVFEKGAAMPLLEGVALTSGTAGDGWSLRLVKDEGGWLYQLVGEEAGDEVKPIKVEFVVGISRENDWRSMAFRMPNGVVVPVRLEGLGEEVSFDPEKPLRPEWVEAGWLGYLNAAGEGAMRWRAGTTEDDGALFFSTEEIAEVRVGAGLVRQDVTVEYQVLQGKLEEVNFSLEGEGEILAVSGEAVVGWKVVEKDGSRIIEVRLSRPIEGREVLRMQTQSALASLPIQMTPLKALPIGTLRHSGHLRLANQGAVRLEVAGASGLMQLAPSQFPGGPAADGLRQIFVYRFPSADYRYEVKGDHILPEVNLNEVTIHEMGESDRRVLTDLEFDIREAPIREWVVGLPDGFAVASVEGVEVVDYSLASEAREGVRDLKVVFRQAISGRHLVKIALEKNAPAAAGEWVLPRLRHAEAKVTRGQIGVVTAAGYRVSVKEITGLSETPVDFFPKKIKNLQQAFRIREAAWTGVMEVEALGQSIQADIFHLYTLKEGIAYGSVILNFFVVGAPANEWRIKVPEGAGNIEVTGQGIGRDWRREGEELIVPLVKPALGNSTLLVTFEQPMSARGGVLRPSGVRPLGVQSERGYIQVTSPLQVNYEITRSEGSVLKIDPSELPADYRLLTSLPSLAAWQYTTGEVDLEMEVKWYESGEVIGEVIDFASLESHVSRDNQVVTTARLYARSKGSTALEITLPEGAELWETKVSGERVNARKAGEVIRVPLPRRSDTESVIEVELRYGQDQGKKEMRLVAPKLSTAVVTATWTVRGDDGRRLIAKGAEKASAQLVRPVMTETGVEWISSRGKTGAVLMFVLASVGFGLRRSMEAKWVGSFFLLGASGVGILMAGWAFLGRRVNLATLEFSGSAILPGDEFAVEVTNHGSFAAYLSGWGIGWAVLGMIVMGGSFWMFLRNDSRAKWLAVLGVGMMSWAILAQHGGAIVFFLIVGAFFFVLGLGSLGKGIWKWWGGRPKRSPMAEVAALIMVGFALSPSLEAGETADEIFQKWEIVDGQLKATFEVKVRAEEAGQRFLLLRSPAILTDFAGEGMQVIKEGDDYLLVAEKEGLASGRGGFSLRLADPSQPWSLPTGPAAVSRVWARHDQEGREFEVTGATGLREIESDGKWAEIFLPPGGNITFRVRPIQRDASLEETRFFTEVADLYLPGPGVVNGIHRVVVRPAQGLVRELSLKIPEEFTVGEVVGDLVARWRFNPGTRDLRVTFEPAAEKGFTFQVATQKATGTLPVDLSLSPLRVEGGAGAVGMLGLAFGQEAQAEGVQTNGLGPMNLDDFPADLIPTNEKGEKIALLQQVFRYDTAEALVAFKVTPVMPEVRVETTQTLSLGSERAVLAVDVLADITRAGIFKLDFAVPAGLEIEAVSGDSLSHWSEENKDGQASLTLHLKERTIGAQKFTISFVGPAPGTQDEWSVPRVEVVGAARQRGQLTVVPDRGLQVRAVSREQVSQRDPGEFGVARPGALAFRLLQADWILTLAIQELDPWVTARLMHEVTLHEGQTLTQLRIAYRIENAARKSLRVRLPKLSPEARATVRANGAAVGDFVEVEGEEDLWEIQFQRGIAGETKVEIEFQQQSGGGSVAIEAVELLEVRQISYFAGIRTGGRLDASLERAVRGWQKIDWSGVPAELTESALAVVPDFVFQVSEPEEALTIQLVRHDLASSRPLRVLEGELTTLVSPTGAAMTAVNLKIEVSEKSTLRLRLPDDETPLHLLVNGQGVPLVRDDTTWLFYLTPSPLRDLPAELSFSYTTQTEKVGLVAAPIFEIPLENLTWEIFVPHGWEVLDRGGDFELVEDRSFDGSGLKSYLETSKRRSRTGRALAEQEMQAGFASMADGNQRKAVELLEKAAFNGWLDQASQEDARVQYRNLKMQQTVLGLNTRRQRNYLDNRGNAYDSENLQLEQAAGENPILQGKADFDPRQFNQMMVGNTAEETSAMKEIAMRIVDQQMEVMPSAASLEIDFTGQGRVYRFQRSLQVADAEAMSLKLDLRPPHSGGIVFAGLLGLATALLIVTGVRGRVRN